MAIAPTGSESPRDVATYDIVIVGAGPAGLAAAIRLKQLANADGHTLSVCVLEKGSAPGAHILSGAVLDPRALNELLPEWPSLGAPILQPVTRDAFLFLRQAGAWATPQALLPDSFSNIGRYVVSLGEVVRWLAQQAEQIGVEIYSGFAADEVLFDELGAVRGVGMVDQGRDRRGLPTEHFARGMAVHGKYTFFAEGARGHLARRVIARFGLDAGRDPQSYALGLKELWQVPPHRHEPGLVIHTAGWPLATDTYGGGLLYHDRNGRVVAGFVVGLNYRNPYLSPFEEFQRWKTHPRIRHYLEGGQRVGYGARTIAAGGLASLPKLAFPGGALIGCDAGTLIASRIKGIHTAMKSGMLAAEAAYGAIVEYRAGDELIEYPQALDRSWLHAELRRSKNFKQWFKYGLGVATVMTGVEQWLMPRLGVRSPPWTLRHHRADHETLDQAADHAPTAYPKPDRTLTFDRLSSVFLSNTNHPESQPSHLTLKRTEVPVNHNLAHFAGPESRYCPAAVYEFVDTLHGGKRLQVNFANCVHCKACDIKDPTQNIVWVAPETGGPNYVNM